MRTHPTTAPIVPPVDLLPPVLPPEDVVTLVPVLDGRTGDIVYAEPEAPAPATAIASDPPSGKDPVTSEDGTTRCLPGAQTAPPTITSQLPREVMAATWEEVRRAMREHELGGNTATVPAIRPGGDVVLHDKSTAAGQQISVLPRDVMAATEPSLSLSAADLDEVERLDPHNVEDWKPVYGRYVSGFQFTLSAHPFPALDPFVFFAFRSADDGGLWRVAVIQPNMDNAFGHTAHIIRARVGSQQRAVLCGPGGRACRTLGEARGHAGKWKVHAAARMAGCDPGFSL